MKQKKHAQILAMFQKLYDACRAPDAYLVPEVAEKLNLDYELIQKHAKTNDELLHTLEMCRDACWRNVEDAGLKGILDLETTLTYSLHNMDESYPEYPLYVAELKKIKEEKEALSPESKTPKVLIMENNVTQAAEITDKDQPETRLTDNATMQACFDLKSSTEQARIKEWRKKQAETNTPFRFVNNTTVYDDKTKQTNVTVKHKFDKDFENDTQQDEVFFSTLFAATGSTDPEYAHILFGQTINACNDLKDGAKSANAVMSALLEMAPKDPYEGMLISRLITLHSQYMRFMHASNASQSDKAIDLNINRATKLMRVYNETLEALNRYRRKGEQRVVVQHVNVNNGGQAIVASEYNQKTRGEGNAKK